MSDNTRGSGLLLHVTSLPSPHGIGDLGPAAHQFAAAIGAAGQRYWQMLPIGPTGYANSPYQGTSAFAGNLLLISLDRLVEQGLLAENEVEPLRGPSTGKVDFGHVTAHKPPLLRLAARRYLDRTNRLTRRSLGEFCERHSRWLDDFALFTAIKTRHGERPWTEWATPLAHREPRALKQARRQLRRETDVIRVLQYLFFEQWEALKDHAAGIGLSLVGDIPLYVAHDSADVWVNQDGFLLDSAGMPTVVAGVPPDYFSETGQRWGNPIYDWEKMAADGFGWWRSRIGHALSTFDMIRVDHFRGIAGYWEIPASETTAVGGRWRVGPGAALLDGLVDAHGAPAIVAEDLGVITGDVIALREHHRLPGMRIAQFGFDDAPDSSLHHPDQFPTEVWAYTGTHDNDTTMGWFWEDNPRHHKDRLDAGRIELLDLVGDQVAWGLIRLVAESAASVAIYPVQDILELGSGARMNTPATTDGNWEWRLREGELADDVLERLRSLTEETGRAPGSR